MARFMRLEVINTLLDIGLVPLFYNADVETSIELASACSRGGAKVIEFTNRGELAYPVFTELVKHFAKADPSIILGVGSIVDAPTAALYLAAVQTSSWDQASILRSRSSAIAARFCTCQVAPPKQKSPLPKNMARRFAKSSQAKRLADLRSSRAVMAPCPWHRLMPTGGVDATEASVSEWIKAGAAAVGMGSKLYHCAGGQR